MFKLQLTMMSRKPWVALLLMISIGISCISCISGNNGGKRLLGRSGALDPKPSGNNSGNGSGNSNGNASGNDLSGESALSAAPQVELRSFVDPVLGSFREKISIPKNFNGYLYISGINISTLNDRLIKVRFRFGRELEAVVIPATIGRATGLIPNVDIQVLILDMRHRPFDNIRLLYDLYDYNSYNYDTSDAPVQDPYDANLYCRGLALDYDPTYVNGACLPGERHCLYAYAKIRDAGFYDSIGISLLPKRPQIDSSGSDFLHSIYPTPTDISSKNVKNLYKCLPDNGALYFRTAVDAYREVVYEKENGTMAGVGSKVLSIDSNGERLDYYYKGPYRPISLGSWAIATPVAIGEYGIFKDTLDGSSDINQGIFSFMFPRAGKMELGREISYLGSDTPFVLSTSSAGGVTLSKSNTREIDSLIASGESKWMDGCNLRMSNYDENSGEGIGSCNVTATIELIAIDRNSGAEQEVQIYNKSELKLQLLRRSKRDYANKETLYQSMKSCSASRECGGDECCFNKRCWSKRLVSQCIEDAGVEGNMEVGDACTSDYECASLCCNLSIGRCAVSNRTLEPPVFCSKSPGEQCISREWCRREVVKNCMIVFTGRNGNGQATCALRCYSQLQHGLCIEGHCVAPISPQVPTFDPNNPDCTSAQQPPLSM
ncbi:MAG: hypothetical protein HQK50_06820 [Oligoflexia bacterium]|nr:hypothetical protein [Oligoflexia bacterium]MBF0365266.1 hypothetical protein [Oligoflexia bacterium]